MPAGRTHAAIGAVGAAALIVGAELYFDPAPTEVLVGLGIGSLIGLLALTPDLDQEGTTITEQFLYAIPVVGWIVGYFFQWGWYGYARLFRHRGWSHHWLVGWPTRVIWTLVLLNLGTHLVMGYAYDWTGQAQPWFDIALQWIEGWFSATVALAWLWQDLLHIGADWLVTALKNLRRYLFG